MSTLSSALGNSSAPSEWEWHGQKYKIRPLGFTLLSDLGKWLLKREMDARVASDQALVEVGALTWEQVIARKDAFTDEAVNTGRYSLGSPRMMEVFGVMQRFVLKPQDTANAELGKLFEPVMKLVSLMLGTDFDTAVNMFHECGPDLMQAIGLELKESLPDPKGAAAAASPAPPNAKPGNGKESS